MPANPEEIVGYGLAGYELGGPIGAVIGTGYGIGKGWYDRHQDKVKRLRLEALNTKIARSRNEEIERAILLQNESARQSIDKQLQENIRQTDIQYAQSGAYSTGARIGAENRMRQDAVDTMIRTAGQNALAGQQLKQNALALDRDYDLKIAQLEAAKQAGDTEMISSVMEELAPMFYEKLIGGTPKTASLNPPDVDSDALDLFFAGEPNMIKSVDTGEPNFDTDFERARKILFP